MSIYVCLQKKQQNDFYDRIFTELHLKRTDNPDDPKITMRVYPAWGAPSPESVLALGWDVSGDIAEGEFKQVVLIGCWPASITDYLEVATGDKVVTFDGREEFAKWLKNARPEPQLGQDNDSFDE